MSTTENDAGASTTGLKSVRRLPPEVSILAVLLGIAVVFEILGVPEELAREAFRLAAAKLPLRTTFVARMVGQ